MTRPAAFGCLHGKAAVTKGHAERLPSGSWGRSVCRDRPGDGQAALPHGDAKTAEAAQVKLARLSERAVTGRQPETDATVAVLLERYIAIAELDPAVHCAR
jgi:hypothetical protein